MNTEPSAPSHQTVDRHIRVSESRLRDAKEIFGKANREQGLRIIVDKD